MPLCAVDWLGTLTNDAFFHRAWGFITPPLLQEQPASSYKVPLESCLRVPQGFRRAAALAMNSQSHQTLPFTLGQQRKDLPEREAFNCGFLWRWDRTDMPIPEHVEPRVPLIIGSQATVAVLSALVPGGRRGPCGHQIVEARWLIGLIQGGDNTSKRDFVPLRTVHGCSEAAP